MNYDFLFLIQHQVLNEMVWKIIG